MTVLAEPVTPRPPRTEICPRRCFYGHFNALNIRFDIVNPQSGFYITFFQKKIKNFQNFFQHFKIFFIFPGRLGVT